MTWAGGFGIVGQGVTTPSQSRTRSDLCPELNHPGATYNRALDRTWCLCGAEQYPGNTAKHIACCGGPLVEYLNPDGTYGPASPTNKGAWAVGLWSS